MAKYLLRAVKQVVVYELTGKERVIDADTEARRNLLARQFLTEEFPAEMGPDPSIEVEIGKMNESVVSKPLPDDFQPKNRGGINPGGAPF